MISFEQARQIVADEFGPSWEGGTFYVDPDGRENAEVYAVRYGHREWIVEGDESFMLIPGVPALVSKQTGVISHAQVAGNWNYFDAMLPVSK